MTMKFFEHRLVFLVIGLASIAMAQLLTDGYSSLPLCAQRCSLLQQVAASCNGTQTADQATWNCFCQSTSLTPLYKNPTGICDNVCTHPSDDQQVHTWFVSNCGKDKGALEHPNNNAQPVTGENSITPAKKRATIPATTIPATTIVSTEIRTQTGTPIIFNATGTLTTIFTPGPSCFRGPWLSFSSTQGVLTCVQVPFQSCFPPNYVSLQSIEGGIYSPGVCPFGYAAGRTWTNSTINDTTSICCPQGMSYLQPDSVCASVVSTGAPVVDLEDQTTQYTLPFTAFASTIAVAWAPNDLNLFTPASAPIVAATPTLPAQTSPVRTPIITSSSSHSEAGLSTGGKAGIGVGVGLIGFFAIALGAWLLWRRRKRPNVNVEDPSNFTKAELESKDAEKKFSELGPDGQVSELMGRGLPTEVGIEERHELEGDWHGHEAPRSPDSIEATPIELQLQHQQTPVPK